jgi:hypothetical protein
MEFLLPIWLENAGQIIAGSKVAPRENNFGQSTLGTANFRAGIPLQRFASVYQSRETKTAPLAQGDRPCQRM